MASLTIRRATCQGHGMCAQSAPDFVSLNEDGEGTVSQPDVPEPIPAQVEQAVRSCPTSSVLLVPSATE